MCGRYNLRVSPAELEALFGVNDAPDFPQRYNIAPTQDVPVLHLDEAGEKRLTSMRWGLIPFWSKDMKIGDKLINARGETVAEKPSFRAAFKRRRCLIPASGFYEWRREGKEKWPFHMHHIDDSPFAFAGLWETWQHDGSKINSFTIITTAANEFMSKIHDRMPVLIEPNQFPIWLDHDVDPDALQEFLQPVEWNNFEAVPISQTVNNARNETPDCLNPLKS